MLTFAIPTWNRPVELNVLIDGLVSEIDKYGQGKVKIFVYDDCSTDETPELLAEWKLQYPDIIDYQRGEKNLRIDGGTRGAIMGVKTPWTWIMGDDDMLMPDMLPVVMDLVERNEYRFIHVSEVYRCKGTNGLYGGTLETLCNWIGLMEMISFMSCNICDTRMLQETYRNDYLQHDGSNFGMEIMIMLAFMQQKSAFFDIPAVDLQHREQTEESINRWVQDKVALSYGRVVDGMDILVERGMLQTPVSVNFMRYITGTLIGKVVTTFAYFTSVGEEISDEQWERLRRLVAYLPEKERGQARQEVEDFKYYCKNLIGTHRAYMSMLKAVQEKISPLSPAMFPFNYLPDSQC